MFCCCKDKKSRSSVQPTDDHFEKLSVIVPASASSQANNEISLKFQDTSTQRRQPDLIADPNYFSLRSLNARIGSNYENTCDYKVLRTSNKLIREELHHPSESISIDLCIVVKSAMHSHFCYLGFDQTRKRLFRPIHKTTEEQCFWETDMTVDITYNFTALQFPDENKPQCTILPHSNDDLLVEKTAERTCDQISEETLFHNLDSVAQNSIKEIFGSLIDNHYVYEMTQCKSVGVLRSHGANIQVKQIKKGRIRVNIGRNQFPYTGLDSCNKKTAPYVDPNFCALVILGLARPWKGNHSEYSPKRCTLLVLRILQLL